MTVCKYYLQGNCHFGERCRFEHPRQNQGYTGSGGYNQNYNTNNYGNQRNFGGGGGGYGSSGGGSQGGQQQVRFQNSFGGNQNRFAALSNTSSSSPAKTGRVTGAPQNIKDMSTEEILEVVVQEMKLWDAQKMWPFSCFTYAKDGQCLQGFDDISPEELRKEAYEMQKANNFAGYQQKVAQLANNYGSKRATLQSPTVEVRQKLYAEIMAHKTQSANPASSTTSSRTSTFGQAAFGASGTSPSVFGNTSTSSQGLFGKGATTTSSNQFGAAQPSQALFGTAKTGQGLFGAASAGQNQFGSVQQQPSVFGASQNVGHTSAFGGVPKVGGSVFGGSISQGMAGFTPSSQTASLLGQPPANTQSTGLFGKVAAQPPQAPAAGLFGKSQPAQPTTNATLFGKPVVGGTPSVFGGSTAAPGFGGQQQQQQQQQQQLPPECAVYLSMDQLSVEEKCQFSAAKFEIGKIPIRPPPREMIK